MISFSMAAPNSVLVDAGEGHLLLLAELRVLGEEFHALKRFFMDFLYDAHVGADLAMAIDELIMSRGKVVEQFERYCSRPLIDPPSPEVPAHDISAYRDMPHADSVTQLVQDHAIRFVVEGVAV